MKARAYAADQLFATLDTTTRQLYLNEARQSVSLSDTVGFIRDLPHGLVDAFQATLQEAIDADLLLHVVDASNPNFPEQIQQVQKVLKEIGAQEVPLVLVFNKLDAVDEERLPAQLQDQYELDGLPVSRVFVSARSGEGCRSCGSCWPTTHCAQKRNTPKRMVVKSGAKGRWMARCPWAGRRILGASALIGQNADWVPVFTEETETSRMNLSQRAHRWAMLPQRLRGMFNLNDPRWGRGDDKNDDASRPDADRPAAPPPAEPARDNRDSRDNRPSSGGVASRRIWTSCGVTSTASFRACSAASRAVAAGSRPCAMAVAASRRTCAVPAWAWA